jgi:uncharacterized membrane protein YphA (DoxX/SURF4 family)
MTIKLVRNIARLLTGIVFIFSGFVKAIDPLGSSYKFADYLDAYGLGFLMPLTLVLAILLSTSELLIGLCLFFKIRMKVTSWALLLFMIFFTLTTLSSAIFNPVSDCGCFGDALILTNWQTFFKNLILFIPTIIVFHQRNQFLGKFSDLFEWSIVGVMVMAIVMLSVYCLMNLPLIDFRPYKIGTDIAESMKIPEGVPVDEYETVLVYEKNGMKKEFTLNSPEKPWSDSSWKWVETRNVLIKEGYKPPIHDFSLTSKEGKDITQTVLNDTGYTLLIISYDLARASYKGMEQINKLASEAINSGYKVYGMTASVQDEIHKVENSLKPVFSFYTTDEITLKTMIRSNPGLILLKDGVVINTWHFRNIPDKNLLKKGGLSYSLLEEQQAMNKRLVLILTLIIGLAGISLYLIRLDFDND